MSDQLPRVWIKHPSVKRLFLAIPIPGAWTTLISASQRILQEQRITGNIPTVWTNPDNFHITVRFIGSIHRECIPNLIARLRPFAGSVRPFALPFSRLVAVPSGEPKMIWARFRETAEFRSIVTRSTRLIADFLKTECHGLELQNGHRVIPHVTVARLKGQMTGPEKVSVQKTGLPPVLSVRSLVLYESKTLPDGSVYTTLATFRLHGK